MPQMSPMNWLALFVVFNLTLGLTLCKLHFLYKDKELFSDGNSISLVKNSFTQIK